MRSPNSWCVLVVLSCVGSVVPAFAQSTKPSNEATPSQLLAGNSVGGQMQSNDVLLAQSSDAPTASGASAPVTRADLDALQKEVNALKKKSAESSAITSGWNGEHFYLKSSDGEFLLMPIGSVTEQYTWYGNDYGTPPNTFALRSSLFGVQGKYGKELDFAFTFSPSGTPSIRDAFVDFKPSKAFNVMVGLNKVPFSMEVGTADTAIEFFNRSMLAVLYPDAGGAYRAPGVDLHGELALGDGTAEYWAGAFSGQGLLASGTTNEPELVGRLRFTPFKTSAMTALNKLSFGGSLEHSRSAALSNEMSFSTLMNDRAYTAIPQFRINGNVSRYNAFASWINGPWGVRAEWANIAQDRSNIGYLGSGGIANGSLPSVKGSGFYLSGIYLLTGEDEPVNAIPRVKHPVIGPNSPGESGAQGWGAWAVKARFSHLSVGTNGASCDATTGCPLTPVITPPYGTRTDQYTVGVNWYLNYWVLAKSEINLDKLKDPNVAGILPRNFTTWVTSVQYRF